MKTLAAFLAVSLIIHICILLIPFPEKKKEIREVIPVSFVIEKKTVKKEKKPAPKPKPKKTAEKEIKDKKLENTPDKSSAVSLNKDDAERDFKPKGADDPLVMPDIIVPKSSMESEEKISVPDIDIKPEKKGNDAKGGDIKREIAAIEKERNSDNKSSAAASKEAKLPENTRQSNMYNLDITPSGNRKIVVLPPEPEFALSNDTKVTVRFNIDNLGNTYNISFITRSSADAEKMALDYVGKMKFEAILDDRKDFAQITIFFKVRR